MSATQRIVDAGDGKAPTDDGSRGCDGLVCGYLADGAGGIRSIEWHGMDAALAEDGSLVCLHFDLGNSGAQAWIETCRRIPPPAPSTT